MKHFEALLVGFIEGRSEFGRTYPTQGLNEWYDWGRSIRRLSRKH